MKLLFDLFKKLNALVLALIMVIGCADVAAYAYENENRGKIYFEDSYENPLYFNADADDEHCALTEELSGFEIREVRYADAKDEQAKRDSAIVIRDNMIARNSNFSINIKTTRTDYTALVKEIFNLAVSKELANSPVAGDYLAWQYGGYSYTGTASAEDDYYDYTFNFTVNYYTTAAQEKKVTTAIRNAITDMKLNGLDDYNKIKKVYEYVCKTCNYDHNAKATDYLRFSAYGAIIDGKAVCQGYATLLYRILQEIGIENKIVTSIDHSWNIINLDGKFYNADVTWDDEYYDKGYNFAYFMKCATHFTNHFRESEYKTAAFNNTYNMTLECYADENTVKTKAASTPCSDKEGVAVVTVATAKLTAVNPIANGFTAIWGKINDAVGYQLQYSKKSNFTSATTVNVADKGTVSRKVTGAGYGEKYYLRVRAYKKNNGTNVYGAWSAVKSITTPTKPATVKLSNVTAESKAFTVKWNKVADATGYQVQYSTNSNFTKTTTENVSSQKTVSKRVTKLAAKEKYFVRVRAVKNVNGTAVYGNWSAVKSVLTKK